MLTLAYFQIWTGYTMLSIKTTMLCVLQLFFSGLYALAENTVLEFETMQRLFRPDWVFTPVAETMGSRTKLLTLRPADALSFWPSP